MKVTLLTILFVFISGFWSNFNNIARVNNLKDVAYQSFFERDFESSYFALEELSDSLRIEEAGIILNKANNSYYLGGLGTLMKGLNEKPDSIRQEFISLSRSGYQELWLEENAFISSVAYNQSGVLSFKSRENDEIKNLSSAIDMFKEAMRKDPYNEAARYNYEILKRFQDYPGLIMERVKELVRLRKYMDAYNLLSEKVTNDYRFQDQQEFLKRLTDIVKIEGSIE